ncbi:MAG: sugar phosphate nucleotidyltransferase [Candidatus Woesearchaeota archaeon]
MKERVTLTIEASVLRQVDARVDQNTIRNRSHAVELLLREALRGSIPETAIILAGSRETQIQRVLSKHKEQPILQHNIELLLQAGVQNIYIITSKPQQLQETIPEYEEIRYLTETTPLGTAGALHLASPYIETSFLVLNADDYKELSLQDMYAFHTSHAGLCSIALTTTNNPEKYGVALLNGNKIITFIEKPSQKAPSNLISAGCYIMQPEALELIPEGYATLETDLFPKLTQTDNLYGYPFSGEYKHL